MAIYRIGQPVGFGGMAVVHRAWKLLPDGSSLPVAVKRIRAKYHRDSDFIALLCREARVCMGLGHNHPNLVSVFEFDRDERGHLFLVMEYVDGVTLDDLTGLGPLPFPVIRRLLCNVLSGLEFAHRNQVLHRDISPCNILVSRHGEVKLTDFGLAKLEDGSLSIPGFKGKVTYASSEAIQCANLTPSSDLYSLAAVLYQLVMGKPPFGYGSLEQIHRRMIEWRMEPLPDEIPEDLRIVVTGLLQYTPEERRFPSASSVLSVLRESAAPMADQDTLAALVAQAGERLERPSLPGDDDAFARTLVVPPVLMTGGSSGQDHVEDRAISLDRVDAERRSVSSSVATRKAESGPRQKWRRPASLLAALCLLAGLVMVFGADTPRTAPVKESTELASRDDRASAIDSTGLAVKTQTGAETESMEPKELAGRADGISTQPTSVRFHEVESPSQLLWRAGHVALRSLGPPGSLIAPRRRTSTHRDHRLDPTESRTTRTSDELADRRPESPASSAETRMTGSGRDVEEPSQWVFLRP